ncbi:hypothetical protein CNY89_19440, partial [Amaricoccus sp. HAR-UPW-R2A-40]
GNLTFQLNSVLTNDLLLAIPLFTFMGTILERSGAVRRAPRRGGQRRCARCRRSDHAGELGAA